MTKTNPDLIAKMSVIPFDDLFFFWAFATLADGPTAAKALNLTPTGLSVAICRLQNRLGVKLFRRLGHGRGNRMNGGPVILSPHGQALFDRLDPLFARFPGAIRAAKQAR